MSFRDAPRHACLLLLWLRSVRRTGRNLVFMCLVLPWYVVCFWKLWCADNSCNQDGGDYKQVGMQQRRACTAGLQYLYIEHPLAIC